MAGGHDEFCGVLVAVVSGADTQENCRYQVRHPPPPFPRTQAIQTFASDNLGSLDSQSFRHK